MNHLSPSPRPSALRAAALAALTGLGALALATALGAAPAAAQGAQVAFGGLRADTSLPVEVTADALAVNQADGSATFSGNVAVSQGEMRLTAGEVRVIYATADKREIQSLVASGGVTLVAGPDAAEAQQARYTIAEGTVVLEGGVVLTQGANVLSGERLTVNLTDGTGRMEGRVRTVLQPGGN